MEAMSLKMKTFILFYGFRVYSGPVAFRNLHFASLRKGAKVTPEWRGGGRQGDVGKRLGKDR